MADVDFDEFDGGYAEHDVASGYAAGRARAMINMAGAVCSIALVIGLGIWGYKLAVRDVSGIPVVRALEGPLRIAPENPGGDVAMHQGLSVNAVAAAGTALPLPDKLILAPRDVALTEEDQAGTAALAPLPEATRSLEGAAPAEVTASAEPSLAPIEIDPVELGPVEAAPGTTTAETIPLDPAMEASSLAVSEPLPATQEDAVAAALAAALADGESTDDPTAATEVAAADPVTSIRPKLRPTTGGAAAVAAAAPVAAETPAEVPAPAVAAAEIDPSTIVAGTRLVQLGAFDDEASARAEWAKLQANFPDLLAAKAMVVQSAQSGGRTFYRLRAHGFADEDVARQFCAAMLAQNASCIPVAQK
ncbi:SPOR domain-containing protein [Cypionkella sp.]|uniref:SPOR domain-containing protein n=1 Tax=Cypionkella sp. TaxID=2811411 RepID=UPI002AB8B58E|nr:SPOR domain-containing protein [Cypionkella sp.]MDZ4393748.1 SPOR domain-containing protein [Cypionkella sp.]